MICIYIASGHCMNKLFIIVSFMTSLLIFFSLLYQNCEILTRTVEETGVIMREIRDLEDQVFLAKMLCHLQHN